MTLLSRINIIEVRRILSRRLFVNPLNICEMQPEIIQNFLHLYIYGYWPDLTSDIEGQINSLQTWTKNALH